MLDIEKIREIILLSSGNVWGITSINKQVGKSYISRMLADELNKVGKSVLFFSVGEKSVNGSDYELQDLKEVLKSVDDISVRKNVCISDLKKIDSIVFDPQFDELINFYKANYDYVIMDIKALDECGFAKCICKKCDENLLVISKGAEDGISAGEKINQLQKADVKVSGVILNEYSSKKSILQM